MTAFYDTILYGKETIRFKLLFGDRKTLEIAVHPDKTVVVKAPRGTGHAVIRKKVFNRAGWIRRQIHFFQKFDPRTPERNYVGGETHLYLGRKYRLKIDRSTRNDVKLVRGFFRVGVDGVNSSEHIKCLMDAWYAEKALLRFQESFNLCWPLFERLSQQKPRMQICRMKKRWGSISKKGLLTLNTGLIRAPRECIDYVITHELCHLLYHDHGPDFYRLLEKVMPDWEKRKTKLELELA